MVSQGYSPKDLFFGSDGKSRLFSGVQKLSMAVRSTLGPSGNTVLIESPSHTHGITVTKDGVTVARSIDLMDPVENLAVRMMKEAADKTALSAGDGTTTSIVLTEALVHMGMGLLDGAKVNRTAVLRRLVELMRSSVPVNFFCISLDAFLLNAGLNPDIFNSSSPSIEKGSFVF